MDFTFSAANEWYLDEIRDVPLCVTPEITDRQHTTLARPQSRAQPRRERGRSSATLIGVGDPIDPGMPSTS
jgi:hypothetical protein